MGHATIWGIRPLVGDIVPFTIHLAFEKVRLWRQAAAVNVPPRILGDRHRFGEVGCAFAKEDMKLIESHINCQYLSTKPRAHLGVSSRSQSRPRHRPPLHPSVVSAWDLARRACS